MVKAVHTNYSYMMFAANISPIRNKYINFKFDTGATRTVISVNALMDKEYTLEEQKEQFHQIKNAKDALVIDEFTSASGDKMGGIKCCASYDRKRCGYL